MVQPLHRRDQSESDRQEQERRLKERGWFFQTRQFWYFHFHRWSERHRSMCGLWSSSQTWNTGFNHSSSRWFRDGCFFRTHLRTAGPIPFYPGELSDRPDCPLSVPPRSCSSNTRWLRSLHDHPLIWSFLQHKVVPGVLKNRSVHTELPHQV